MNRRERRRAAKLGGSPVIVQQGFIVCEDDDCTARCVLCGDHALPWRNPHKPEMIAHSVIRVNDEIKTVCKTCFETGEADEQVLLRYLKLDSLEVTDGGTLSDEEFAALEERARTPLN